MEKSLQKSLIGTEIPKEALVCCCHTVALYKQVEGLSLKFSRAKNNLRREYAIKY